MVVAVGAAVEAGRSMDRPCPNTALPETAPRKEIEGHRGAEAFQTLWDAERARVSLKTYPLGITFILSAFSCTPRTKVTPRLCGM